MLPYVQAHIWDNAYMCDELNCEQPIGNVMFQNWQYWPIVRPFVRLLSSSKFIALLLAALAADFGLDLSAETTALIYAAAAFIYAGTTAIEDAAVKRSTAS